MTFQRLLDEHDQIDAFSSELEAVCLRDVPDPYAVSQAQFNLRQALDEHFAHEEEALYARLMGTAGTSVEGIEQFQAQLRLLCADWNQYLSEWDAECLNADWPGFRAETMTLMKRVRARTGEETKLIYTQALKHGLIPLRTH
jgi:hypothetical protein